MTENPISKILSANEIVFLSTVQKWIIKEEEGIDCSTQTRNYDAKNPTMLCEALFYISLEIWDP